MNKTRVLAAVFALLAACAYKLPEAEVLKIFARHSFKEHSPEKLSALLRGSGLAGLKLEDKYSEVVLSKRRVKKSPVKPAPSAGMLVGAKGGAYYLLRVFKGSPAEAAGLKDGDKLLAVNSSAPGSEEFFKALSGSQEFRIKAARRTKAGVSEFEAEVKAGEFSLPLVFGLYEPETSAAFVRIGLFFEDSAAIAAAGLGGLRRSGAKSVILDLRGNKGGSPEEAAALLKLFASKPGPVLAITSRHTGYTQVFAAEARGKLAGTRVAVLVDPATSMTGEVFAASLKEIAGAAVIGGKTAGSVSIQRTFALGEGRGLRLTVARLAPPSGSDLEGAGLAPDSPVDPATRNAWSSSPADALLKDPAYLRALEILKSKTP
ncbi:MAG: S41 family peptidase [Elusimicrobiota bacterium]|nr:S41 family peptidase [Elusimicrobiota bacterium]